MLNKPESVTVGFDIGGTNMRAAAVTVSGDILDAQSVPTPRTADGLEAGIKDLVERLSRQHRVEAVGLAVAGFLDPEGEVVRFAPHLPWRDRRVREELEASLGLPVKVEHDANAAAWGEYRFGGARGVDNWVLFALGTGIGATLMNEGAIYRGAFGTAPEFGHLTVVSGGRLCACGKRGCLERYCSGTAVEETGREFLASWTGPTMLRELDARGELTGATIMNAAREGDELALRVVDDFAMWLGRGLAVVADVLDPALILLGGGVSKSADLYLDSARAHLAENIVGSGYRPLPRVACAELGADAGMIGVADLARQRVAVG